MLRKIKTKHFILLLFLFNFLPPGLYAQFSLTGQLRTRTEIRNGLGNLVLKGSKAAAFTSQRTRAQFRL